MLWNAQIEKVDAIKKICLGKDVDSKEENLDKFVHIKKSIHKKIKLVKELIKRKDENSKILARNLLSEISLDFDLLIKVHEKNTKNKEHSQLFDNRSNIIRLVGCHIRECELLLFPSTFSTPDFSNMIPLESNTLVALPDIDLIPDLEISKVTGEMDARDKEIDLLLDKVHKGVVDIKESAIVMQEKVAVSIDIIDDVQETTVDNNESLLDTNRQMVKVLKTIRSPSKFCCTVVLVLLLLGAIGTLLAVVGQRYF